MQSIGKTNARYKIYPDHVLKQVANRPIFSICYGDDAGIADSIDDFIENENANEPDSEAAENKDPAESKDGKDSENEENNRAAYVARRRAVQAIRDIALCNPFEYMVTLTLDGSKISRYDTQEILKKLKYTLSNLTRRKGLLYLLIPEFHRKKDNEKSPAIHFHGLIIPGELNIEPSMVGDTQRTDRNGRLIYNTPDWPYGFSVLKKIDENYTQAINYITKYVSKQEKKILGKYYLSSRALVKKPSIIPIENGEFYDLYKDEEKIRDGRQHEINLYGDVYIISERVEEIEEVKQI
ncbi:MAG: hypothetical protein LJU34_00720 [Oscillospiraceae bacterium]|nr:hypothetical protein [Oscillospiraceae bacterium]